MRLFAATLATETNTFSPLPTSLASLPLDGVLPGLRGAMVAHGYDDVEGDSLERGLVVKPTNHVMAAFGPISQCVIHVDGDARLSRDDRQTEYVKVNRPIWPPDANTRPALIF